MAGKKQKPNDEDSLAVVVRRSADLSTLPENVQRALANYKVKERTGIAPNWEPEEGDFIIGTITAARQAGQFASWVVTVETKDGPFSVWLNSDLKTKLNAEEEGLVGRHVVIQFESWLTKEDNPRLKGDMRIYKVIEVQEKDIENAR